jgi:hypothetical protein
LGVVLAQISKIKEKKMQGKDTTKSTFFQLFRPIFQGEILIGLEVPRFFDLIASRSVLFQLERVFILPMVPLAA